MLQDAVRRGTSSWKRARVWVPLGGVLGLVGGAAILTLALGPKAFDAKEHLEAALPLAAQAQDDLLKGDIAAATANAETLRAHTSSAKELTSGTLWKSVEWMPIVGDNLHAVRIVAEVADDLVREVLVPAAELDLTALAPADGEFDEHAIVDLHSTVDSALSATRNASSTLASIDRAALVPQLAEGIARIESALDVATVTLHAVEGPLALLPDALGADGSRNYLFIFQNNAELRAQGGNPAAMLLVTADRGKVSIGQQASSTSFTNNRAESIIPLDPVIQDVYTSRVGTYVQNITSTADFRMTAQLALAYWNERFGPTAIDGVLSFDPVALSYLLSATGPVGLATGEELSSDNAVPLLLNEVYHRYSEGEVQDAFFADAAARVFEALTSRPGDPLTLLSALARSADEGRLLMWSAHEPERDLLATTPMAGILPADNSSSTTMGLYLNDTTGAKMDYYVDASISATSQTCGPAPQFSADVTLTNSMSRADAASLPLSITGPYYQPGFIATDIVFYGPVGAHIDSVAVAGKSIPAAVTNVIDGRPIVRLGHVLAPSSSITISFTLTGAHDTDYGPLEVRSTPMVRETPIEVSEDVCEKTGS